jgi:hypothetical protein
MPSRTYTIFVEYRIQKEKWEEFKEWLPQLQATIKEIGMIQRHSFLSGRDQPHFVVEVMEIADEQVVEQICHRRQAVTDPIYLSLLPWLDRENANIHIWVFEPITPFLSMEEEGKICRSK